MFSFFQTVLNKATSLVAGIFIALGLISAPAQFQVIETPRAVEEQNVITAEPELVTSEIEKLKKEIEELKKQKAASASKDAPSAPKVIEKPKPKTFQLPSGAIIDERGTIINQNELYQKQTLEELERRNRLLDEQNRTLREQTEQTKQQAAVDLLEQKYLLNQLLSLIEGEVSASKARTEQILTQIQEKKNQIAAIRVEYDQLIQQAKTRATLQQFLDAEIAKLNQEMWVKINPIQIEINQLETQIYGQPSSFQISSSQLPSIYKFIPNSYDSGGTIYDLNSNYCYKIIPDSWGGFTAHSCY